MNSRLEFRGVMPANLMPFHEDLSINEKDYRRHLSWLANAPGITAIVCNGHAAEVSSLDRDERRRALAIAVDEVGDIVPLIAGVYTDGSLEAAQLAKDCEEEGASGLLIFPPQSFQYGGPSSPGNGVCSLCSNCRRRGPTDGGFSVSAGKRNWLYTGNFGKADRNSPGGRDQGLEQ